jgi:hypothetical protein
MVINDLSPEGAKPGFEMSFALSGLRFKKHDFPGRCPGLKSYRPLGAQIAGKTLAFPPKYAQRNAIAPIPHLAWIRHWRSMRS